MSNLVTRQTPVPHIRLIAVPQVDWHNFVGDVNDTIGRSPTRNVDHAGMKAGSLLSYIASLAEFRTEGSEAHSAIREASRLLQHLSFTFLCTVDDSLYLQILKSVGTDLFIDYSEKGTFLATANLKVWKQLVIENCKEQTPATVRLFFNGIYIALCKLQLSSVWDAYQKRTLSDGTIIFT